MSTEILHEVSAGLACITLNRPAALNALSYAMVLELDELLRAWMDDAAVRAVLIVGAGEKAFCAGGDIRALHRSFVGAERLHEDFFVHEYRLDYLIHEYPKPVIALLDGITMGGGMGLAQGAQLRVVTDRTRIAMPEVGIGLIPDVGASYFLSRLPGSIGLYLALTGNQVRAADALYAGLADLYLPPSALPLVRDAATAGLNSLRALGVTQLPDPPLAALRPAIDLHFAHADIGAILQSLRAETRPEYAVWAQQTVAIIGTRSPLTVAVTLRQLQSGKTLTLAQCFRLELGLVHHCFERGDFIEGVRALIVDKDNAPRWRHGSVNELAPQGIDAFFADPWHGRAHPLRDLG